MKLERVAFSTNAFKRTPLGEAVREIASLGYRGVEVMADAPHMRPDRFTDAEARELKKLLDGLGMTVSNVNAFTGFCFPAGDTYHPTWVEEDRALRRARVDHTKRAVELGALIGADRVSVQPGGPYLGRDEGELLEMFAEGLSECAKTARAYGVTIGVEPEPGLVIERSDQFVGFKERYFRHEPAVRMNCDLGHFYCVREDPAEVVRRCHASFGHVHLEDISSNRVHQHLVPGDGAMDFRAILSALDSVAYDGWVTVELYPYTATATEAARRAFDYLKPMLQP